MQNPCIAVNVIRPGGRYCVQWKQAVFLSFYIAMRDRFLVYCKLHSITHIRKNDALIIILIIVIVRYC